MQPKVYTVDEHDIALNLIDSDALFVLNTLREAGYVAYLVGGSVRDLLLKRTPKDYDISTSALPEEIKKVFQRRCILIGRRFRLAHIRFGHKIIEVSTFRTGEAESDLIVHDNEWGTPEQDVLRRDFTINGLFYDPANHTIIDYVGGWEDIHQNILRTIGHAETRFKQDPVRMIRLLKFRARFGFQISLDAKKALIKCREEIIKSSQARILEEILRMLESGAAAPFFSLMQETGLLKLLYPLIDQSMKHPQGKQIMLYLAAADKINSTLGKRKLDRAILLTCLLFPLMQDEIAEKYLKHDQIPHLGEVSIAATSVMKHFAIQSFTQFPRRLTVLSHSIISTQYRLTPLAQKAGYSHKIFKYKEFPIALGFLQIRALVDKQLIDAYAHWKNLSRQQAHPERKNPSPHTRSRE